MKISTIIIAAIVIMASACKPDKGQAEEIEPTPEVIDAQLQTTTFFTEKGSYKPGEVVKISSFAITSETDVPLVLKKVQLKAKSLSQSDASFIYETTLAENKVLQTGEKLTLDNIDFWKIPANLDGPIGIFSEVTIESPEADKYVTSNENESAYQTFFRVSQHPELNTYNIYSTDFQGMSVFTLNRGLSAEYSVQKSASTLKAGISHSWALPLKPVNSTPQFLEKSIRKTIDFYNQQLGTTASFETVVISTGIPSAIYLGGAMKAPILPLHFLVGAESVKEVQSILDYSNANGYSAYAAYGHDYSISTTAGVAWIKMLDIPDEYIRFIQEHQVKNVVLLGYSGGSAGEVQARKIADQRGKYDPGSIYLMYFAGNMAETYLRQVINDFDECKLTGLTSVADWESGIIPAQYNNFSHGIRNKTGVTDIRLVTSNSDIALWDLGAYLSLAYLSKNKDKYEASDPLKGITLNPYLIGHPFYESRMGYIPFLYWQGIESGYHIGNRLQTVIKSAINQYFPEKDFNEMMFWVNCTSNFGGSSKGVEMVNALKNHGYTNVRQNDFSKTETWNPSDGMNASSEQRAKELLIKATADELMKWERELVPLTPADLDEISRLFNEIDVVRK